MSDLKQKLIPEDQDQENINIPITPNTNSNAKENEQNQNDTKQDFEEVENYDPSPFVLNLKDKLQNMEYKFRDGAGMMFLILGILLLSSMQYFRKAIMPQNTNIEIIFIAFLVAFLINYYLTRIGNILPYIENENDNFVAKLAGFSLFGTIVFLLYSFQYAEINSCIFIFILTWVISYVTQKFYNGINIPSQQFGLILLMTVCSYLILTPKFLLSYHQPEIEEGQQISDDQAQQIIEKANEYTNQQQKGLISALLASLCFSYMSFNVKKIKETDVFTITHIVCLIVVLFLPVFFPIENVVSPSAIEWIVMVGFGVVFLVVLQLVIRSLQIENPAKILGSIPLFLGFAVIFNIFLGIAPGFLQVLGCAGIITSSFLLYKINYRYDSKVLGQEKQLDGTGSGIQGNFIELKQVQQ